LPYAIIDLDRLDQNIDLLKRQLAGNTEIRLVAKSLPSQALLAYLMERLDTHRLMVFHQPFLLQLTREVTQPLDILLGKPMPVTSARHFYQNATDHPHRIQWLIDTPERLAQYLQLAQTLGEKLYVNLEIDVGLYRGGFRGEDDLVQALALIRAHPRALEWSGFMGYDPHVVKLPAFLGSPQRLVEKSMARYRVFRHLVQTQFNDLWREDLTFNGAGSPSFHLHQNRATPLNEIAIGSALLKPTTFDIDPLQAFTPACFIAAPVLKQAGGTRLPGIGKLPPWLGLFWPYLSTSYFIYGGYWKADYCYPPDIRLNKLFGASTNQSMLNASGRYPLAVDDYVFLRPWQSEFVLLQFGAILAWRNAEVVAKWKPLLSE
ncbi:MAG: alanine racemase, partial [Bacteroidota bacterium]